MANYIQISASILLVISIGQNYCQISNDLDVGDIEKQLNSIPGLEKLNSSHLPSEEDLHKVLREKCERNGGGEEAYNALINQQTELQTCLEQYLNMTQIQEEIEKAKETGSMDEVFGKYCKKYPEIHGCVTVVTEKVRACLDEAEQATLNKTIQVIDELKEFICFKDGDRIAMFIAEGGVECLESKKEELQECANKTLGSRIPTDFSVNTLPAFLFTDRECNDFDKVRICFNVELEKCKDSTPANIVDAFFKFMKKQLPCSGKPPLQAGFSKETNNSNSIVISSTFITFAAIILAKYI